MRSTFWLNRICERRSSQNRHTGLKFSPKTENSALFMKIVQNPFFRSCGARFGQIASLSVKVVKIVTLASNSLQKGKLCAFYENCTKRSFQVMRSKFWPNRIFERQSSPNRYTGLKFSSKRENSALSMKIVQNALPRSCAARFGQIAFVSVKVVKIVTRLKFSPKKENSALSMKIVQNALFRSSGFRQIAERRCQNRPLAWNSLKTGKQCAFHENCTKRSFQVMRSTFWPNRIFERQSS